MRLRSLYTLVGAAWGIVIAFPATVLVSGYFLAAAWLYFFGEGSLSARPWLVLLPGLALGIAIFAWVTSIGYRYGASAEATLPERQAIIRRRAVLWVGVALLVGVFEAGVAVTVERRLEAESQQRDTLVE